MKDIETINILVNTINEDIAQIREAAHKKWTNFGTFPKLP